MTDKVPETLPLKPIIYTEANPTVLRIVPELAAEIGLSESIVLLQIAYWISISYNLFDGRWWTYQSLADMQEKAFSFWERSTVNRIIERLVERNLVIVGNFNERKGDKTQWFSLHVENLQTLRSIAVMLEIVSPQAVAKRNKPVAKRNSKLQNATTLPENTIENTENNNTPNGAGRKRDPIYDAIASVWATEASGFIVSLKAMLTAKGGRGAWKSCQLSPPATADEITAYGAWAKANKTGTATTPETIQRWFYEYRAQATKTTSAAAIDTTADDAARARARANALNMFAHMTGGNDESTKP